MGIRPALPSNAIPVIMDTFFFTFQPYILYCIYFCAIKLVNILVVEKLIHRYMQTVIHSVCYLLVWPSGQGSVF